MQDDDDDAFLYGGDAPTQPFAEPQATAPAAQAQPPSNEQVQEGDDDEEEDEEEQSDSDVEFIIDTTQELPPPQQRPGFQLRPGMPGFRPGLTQSTPQRPPSVITSEYTPLSRAQLLASPTVASPTKAPAAKEDQAEGPPPPVPSTAPHLKLSPGPEDRVFPPPADSVVAEVETDIFDINIEALQEKPWRRPGADLTDYFNYGFNEQSWSLWRGKKERFTETRKETEQRGEEGIMPMNMQMPMMGMPNPEQMMAMMGMGAPMGMMGGMFGSGPPPPGFPGPPPQQMQGRGPPPPPRNNFNGAQQQGSSTPMGAEAGNEVKDEEDDGEPPYEPTAEEQDDVQPNNMSEQDMSAFFGASGVDMNQVAAAGFNVSPPTGPAGRGASPATRNRGTGWAGRGRGQGVKGAPTGPRGAPSGPAAERAASPLPSNVPTGPRNPGKRYNDRDTGAGAADALDYGATNDDRRSSSRRKRDDTSEDDRRSSRRSRRRDDDSDDTDASTRRRRTRDRESRRSDRRAGKEGSSRKRSQPDEPEEENWSDRDSRRSSGRKKR